MGWISKLLKISNDDYDENDINLLITKANQGDKDAQFDLAVKFATGEGVEKNILKAIELYEPLAQENDFIAIHNLGLLYCGNYGDDKEKLERGLNYFQFASSNGYAPSSCELMKLHLIGFGVEKNHKIAVGYLLRSINDGSEKCINDYYRTIIQLREFGKSIEERILIVEETNGVQIEYELLHLLEGKKNEDWFLIKQTLINENEAQVDKVDIETSKGEKISYYFDISRSFGKFNI